MAVKPEIIKARLKALFPKANLSQKRIDVYAAKLAPKPADDADETAIDAIINDYNEIIDFEAVAKEDDRVRTLEADKKKADELAAKAKGKKKDGEEDEEEEDVKVGDDAPQWAKALIKQNQKLSSEIESIKSGNTKQTKLQSAQTLLEKSEVFRKLDEDAKAFMLKNVDLESETPFEEQITGLETVFGKLVQNGADSNQYAPAAGGGNPITVNEKEAESVLDNMGI